MSINITLIIQMLTFGFFTLFTMKLVWPHIISSLEERKENISSGLEAAEQGKRHLAFAERKVSEQLREAKIESAEIIDRANKRAALIIEEAKNKAREESDRLIELAQADIANEVQTAKVALREKLGTLAVSGAEKILTREIDEAANKQILDQLLKEF